jgi:pilus assembly protein CpaC
MKYLNIRSNSYGRSWKWGLALAMSLFGLAAPHGEETTVLKGTSTQISVPEGVRKISVTNPAFLEARPAEDGKAVMINGLNEGTTEVRIERMQGGELVYKVSVRADLQRVAEEIKELLSDIEGLEVKVAANKVVLKGDIVTKKGFDRVRQVSNAYSGAVMNLTEFDQTAIESLVEKAIIGDIGSDTVRAKVMKDTVILEGVLYSEADVARALQLAKLRMPNVVNLLRVQSVMVETDVQFVQVTYDNTGEFGHNVLDSLQISGTAGLQGGRTGIPSLNYGINASGSAALKALVGSGTAKVLAQPHLSTESGGEGRFQSGGEIFFSVAGNVGGTLEKVNFGVILTVKPSMQGQDSILNEVSVEVSVPSARQQGSFALDKFETKSKVVCKVGESIIMSGLVQTLASRFKDKTPLLGDIPLLNAFFSHKTSSRENKELVVLITPRPVFPQATAARRISEQTQELLLETGTLK